MNRHTCEPVGSADIAARLGVKPNTVAVYNTRGYLPAPRWTVSGFPVWCWQHDIEPILVNGRPEAKKPRRISKLA